MRSHRLQRWLTVGAMLLLPVLAHAQEATLSGTVSDTTGGALPGVTVRAVHEASGNNFEAVTDARGDYRIPARVGAYRLTADLAGFAPVNRTVTLLVGQEAVVNLQMSVSGVQESVTVTGEAPLLDVTQSSMGGNVDPRQLQELPVNGRSWLDLVLLAPGARLNSIEAGTPGKDSDGGAGGSRAGGDFQINVDGQNVTQLTTGAVGDSQGKGQARFNRDAIAEFEYLSSRFDATQGRSSGLQVNAVTKSGTNTPSGSFSGYFRDDSFIAADFVAKRVLPYQNQQLSATFGGPIRKDKLHFFANYEYEREPHTFIYTTPYPYFNRDRTATRAEKKSGLRLDAQFSPRTRLAFRANRWLYENPNGGGASSTPAGEGGGHVEANQLLATLTQVLSNRVVNEVKVGYNSYLIDPYFNLKNPNALFGTGSPIILLQDVTVGSGSINPNREGQDVFSFRDDFTYSFAKGGRHTMKLGAEYVPTNFFDLRCVRCNGELDATRGPLPAGVTVESLFPNLFDVSTWNLAPLSPITVRWREGFIEHAVTAYSPRYTTGVWVQDDWTLSPRLTLNLGLRYDVELDAFVNDVKLGPFLTGNKPNDTNNVGPRLGFSFSLNDRTVLRGGYGLYFATVADGIRAKYYGESAITHAVANDGRPDFASNPYDGKKPTYAQLAANFCTPALERGCIRREAPTAGAVYGPHFKMPYSHQSSIGFQRQMGPTMAIEADYVYIGSRDRQNDQPVNVGYDPATGVNYPFSDISKRPFPDWGYVSLTVNGSRSNSHALQTGFTKRMSNGWQASATYTLAVLKNARVRPLQWNNGKLEVVPFPTAPDLGGEYGLSAGDQRHRAVFNGIRQLPYGFQLSGLYFFGSGERTFTNYGTDLRRLGGIRPNELRLRPNGTIVPRNNFVGKPLHRVDLRLQRRFPLGGRAGIDGLLEVFNVFNHANFGNYITEEVRRDYGAPVQDTSVAYLPRMLQLGFRFTF